MSYEELSVKRQVAASLANGIDIGIERGVIKVAKKMLRDPKVDLNYVTETTGLEREKVLKLKAELED
jgi:hypothetical protein